ncbi:MAG: hypothetical protein LBD67_05555 [Candidatus Accumulibacter sp.]|jgi:hypothetical protein|nr:hypothetical protein [Accumulibacter sp.]
MASISVRAEPVEAGTDAPRSSQRLLRIRGVQGKDIPGLSNPYPSTSSGRTDWKGALREASFTRLKTEQHERIEKHASGKLDGRTAWKGALRQHLPPFVLSLSKQEWTLRGLLNAP